MRRTLYGASLLAAALLLTGCAAGATSDERPTVDGGAPQAPLVDQPGGGGDGSVMGEDSADLDGAEAGREVIVTGNVTITTEDPIEASREASIIVERAGGRVDGRTEYAPSNGNPGSATLTLRIPSAELQAVLDQLADLGRADEITINAYDVTVETQDLEARINALRTTIERLTAILAQATSVEDLIKLETEIGARQGELESLEAQQRSLADQVAMSTISLYLRSEAQAPPTGPGDFWTGLQSGWNGFVAFFSGLLVALGVLLPWIVFAGIGTAAVILGARARRKRAAARG